MATLDAKLRPKAKVLIDKYGKSVTLKKRVGGTYSSTTLSATDTAPEYPCKAVVASPSSSRFKDRGSETESMLTLYVAGLSLTVTPEVGDQFEIDGLDWTIVPDIVPIYSGELVALYQITVKK